MVDDPAQATLQTCITEIAAAASKAGAREVKLVTGRVSRRIHGVRSTTMRVTIFYPLQTREDVIVCTVDRDGNVKIMTEEEANAAQE